MGFHFEAVNKTHLPLIFEWLNEPHMIEFWDNSQAHKDDIINFVDGRKSPSNYFKGIMSYWIGSQNSIPFCFILSCPVSKDDCPIAWESVLPNTGTAYGLDFGIGAKDMIGKGLAAPALSTFTDFFHDKIEPEANTFIIDPDVNNPRAIHVYEKAGFERIAPFIPTQGVFAGQSSWLMIKSYTKKEK